MRIEKNNLGNWHLLFFSFNKEVFYKFECSDIDSFKTMCKTQAGLCINLEGWDREEDGR